MKWRRRILRTLAALVGVFVVAMAAWAFAIEPTSVWRVLTHGTTTVWDHLSYPDRDLEASTDPQPWPRAAASSQR